MNSISFEEALADLKGLMEKVCRERAPTVINRSDGEAVVLLSQSEFESIEETLFLLSSPENGIPPLESIAQLREGKTTPHELIRDEEPEVPEQAGSKGERSLVDR